MHGEKTASDVVDCANAKSAEEVDEHFHGCIGEVLRGILYRTAVKEYSYQQTIEKCDEYDIWLFIANDGWQMGLYTYPINAVNIDAWINGKPLHLF